MAVYGFLVSAPLSHVLVGHLQKSFAGRRIPMLLASNLVASPIQAVGKRHTHVQFRMEFVIHQTPV